MRSELDRSTSSSTTSAANYGLAFASLHPERIATLTIFNTIWSPEYHWHFWGRVWRTKGLGEAAMKLSIRPLFINQIRRGSPAMPRDYMRARVRRIHAGDEAPGTALLPRDEPAGVAGLGYEAARRQAEDAGDLGRPRSVHPQTFATFGVTAQHTPHGHWVMAEDPQLAASAIAELTGP